MSTTPALSTFLVSIDGDEGGTLEKRWGKLTYEIPQDVFNTYRNALMVQPWTNSGVVTISGTGGTSTLTASAPFFTVATDVGKAIVIQGYGQYTIASVTSTTIVTTTSPLVGNCAALLFTMTGNIVFPGDTGTYTRQMSRFHIDRQSRHVRGLTGAMPLFARVECEFETPTIRKLVQQDTHRAFITLRVAGKPVRLKQDPVNLGMIEGDDFEDTAAGIDADYRGQPFHWAVVSGNHTGWQNTAAFTIHTAADTLNMLTMESQVGYVNAAAMTSLGFPAHTVLLEGIDARRTLGVDSLWYVQYDCLFEPGGFYCVSTKKIDAVFQNDGWDRDSTTFKLTRTGRPERIRCRFVRPDAQALQVSGTASGVASTGVVTATSNLFTAKHTAETGLALQVGNGHTYRIASYTGGPPTAICTVDGLEASFTSQPIKVIGWYRNTAKGAFDFSDLNTKLAWEAVK
jgi:hypothetical protein